MKLRGITGLAILGALLGSAPAGADTSNEEEGRSGEGRIAAEHLSSEYGLNEEQAAQHLSEQGAFNKLYTDLKATHREESLDAYILPPSEEPSFHIRSNVAGVIETVETFSTETGISIELERAPAIGSEITDHATENLDQITSVTEDEIQGLYVDLATGEVVIGVYVEEGVASEHQLQEATEFQGVPELESTDVRVVVHDEPSTDAETYGGAAMASCTTGFTAQSTAGTAGFWSAAHGACGQGQTAYSGTTQSTVAGQSTLQSTTYNDNADISYHSMPSAVPVYGSYWGESSTSTTANVTTVTVAQGANICGRGMTTGVRCGVASPNYQPTYEGACPSGSCNASFIMIDGAPTAGGDSGGPWWFGPGEVVGIHKGGSSTWSVASAIQYVPSGTSLQ